MTEDNTLLTIPQVCQLLTISKSTLFRYINIVPDFPRRVRVGPGRVCFLKREVEQYIKDQQLPGEINE